MMGCVLMASGLGRRFGADKLMTDFDGAPLISRAIEATGGLFDKRVLLTRSAAAAEFARARGVAVTLHTLPRRSDAMRLGLAEMAEMDGCLFCPCDQPLLTRQTVEALHEELIPFTKNSKRTPFFKREEYKGADKVWVITINPRRYGQARRVIDRMDRVYKERLVLSNY